MEDNIRISNNLIVHCPTEEVAKKVLKCFHDLGCIWRGGSSCSQSDTHWDTFMWDTCYCHARGRIYIESIRNLRGCQMITGEDFLKQCAPTNNMLKLKKLDRIKLKFTL